jgi:outer membrane protein
MRGAPAAAPVGRSAGLLAGVLGAVLLLAPALPARALTLAEALDLAAQNRPALDTARARADGARADLAGMRAGRLPTVTVSAGATRMDDPAQSLFAKLSQGRLAAADLTPPEALNDPGALTDLTAGVAVSQPLFSAGRVSAGIRAGRAGARAAQARLDEAENDARADVTAAYWDAVLAKEALAVVERDRETARAHLDLARERVAAGAAVAADRLAAEAQVARTERAVAEGTRNLAMARVALESALGLERLPSEPSEPLPATGRPAASEEALVARALDNRPDVRAAEAALQGARADLDGARAGYLPSLDLSAAAADHRASFSGDSGQVWQVGARARWDLTDGGLRGARTSAARARVREAEAARREARQRVRAEVVAARTLSETAVWRLTAARTEVDASEAALAIVRDRYRAGAALFTELKEAEDRLAQADLAALSARHDIAVADAELRRAVGGPIGEE